MTNPRLTAPWTGAALAAFLAIPPAGARDAGPPTPLFADHAVIEVRIEAPLQTLVKERSDEEYLDGTFSFPDTDGMVKAVDLKLRTRGRYRLQKRTCPFPPVRLNFPKSQVEGTLFDGQDKLKLVTHCHSARESYEQQVLREYLAYRILQTLTDKSFGVRLMRITWADTEGDEPIVRWGFVIEDDDDIGERIGMERFSSTGLGYDMLDQRHTAIIALFEYMIGNTDFSLIRGPADDDCCHNAVPFRVGEEMIYSIPYDFDFSGLVDAPYAEPNPQFKIRDVKTRVYRGRCADNTILPEVLGYMAGKQPEIHAIVDGLTGLDDKNRREVTKYIDDFFDIAGDPRKIEKELVRKCN